MKHLYSIGDEMSQEIEDKIMAKVDTKRIVDAVRAGLNSYVDEVTGSLTDFLSSEYALEIDSLVYRRADALVESLLKGDEETGRKFSLTPSTEWHSGKVVSYDNHGVRKAIVDAFKDQIANAEMIELQRRNLQLEDQIKFMRKVDHQF